MCHQLSWQVRCHINLWSDGTSCLERSSYEWVKCPLEEKSSGQTVCDLCEFYAAGAPSPLWTTLTNSPSVLTYKSLSRKLSGHRVSDVPEVISLSLIGDLKKLKKGLPLEVKPSRQQHTKHILCFGLIQLDIHWSFSCFRASLINFVVNSCACSCYFSPFLCLLKKLSAFPIYSLTCCM